jgi:hypothetical protein
MYIMVLNDGETFSDLEGCKILYINDEAQTDDIEEMLQTETDVNGCNFEVVTIFK